MARTRRAAEGWRSTRIAWALAGLLAACGGATVAGTRGAGSDGGGNGGLAASGGAGATAGLGGLPSSGGSGAGGSDASAGASGTGAVAGSGAAAGDAAAAAGGGDAGCPTGYADCNGDPSDGCETHLATDVNHCGACSVACSAAHGTAACSQATCSIASCDLGWGDCDGLYSTGCETDLASDPNDCGACGTVCSVASGTASCVNGSCGICGCPPPYANCDGNCANGCEINTQGDVNNCGFCGSVCAAEPHSSPACWSGACQLQCDVGWGDCDGLYSTGCETDLASDLDNCGGCGLQCPAQPGEACVSGTCLDLKCTPPYADCNADPADGCEANTSTDPNNCGSCGHVCPASEGPPTCSGGICQCWCPPGYAHLDCSTSCSSPCGINLGSDTSNCGACGNVCTISHGTPTCIAGSCAIAACDAGYADCDGQPWNGCETDLSNDVNNCGGCGQACPTSTAGCVNCVGGVCRLPACVAGTGDCDCIASNGCETDLSNDVNNCGACGHVCATGQTCVSGSCQ